MRYFSANPIASVKIIVANKPDAYVLKRAEKLEVEALIINRQDWESPVNLIQELKDRKIDLIVLAGFLWLVPGQLIDAFPNRIINIHPALLPKYGGKGMYGDKVHEEVKKNKETETGITIHYVDKQYDTGSIIFQENVKIDPDLFSPLDIANLVHELEYEWYPKIVARVAERILKEK